VKCSRARRASSVRISRIDRRDRPASDAGPSPAGSVLTLASKPRREAHSGEPWPMPGATSPHAGHAPWWPFAARSADRDRLVVLEEQRRASEAPGHPADSPGPIDPRAGVLGIAQRSQSRSTSLRIRAAG
jgi:hypothetical protein